MGLDLRHGSIGSAEQFNVAHGGLMGASSSFADARGFARLEWERTDITQRRGVAKIANVDLAGDGGGDQCGAAFLQEIDGALGFGGEGVEVQDLFGHPADDSSLLV